MAQETGDFGADAVGLPVDPSLAGAATQYDAVTKELARHSLVVRALLRHWGSAWFRELGVEADIDITATELTSEERRVDLPHTAGWSVLRSDLMIALRRGEDVVGLLALELQERPDPLMAERMSLYWHSAMQLARQNEWITPRATRFPVCLGVIHTGTRPWRGAGPEAYVHGSVFQAPWVNFRLLSIAAWYNAATDSSVRTVPLATALDVFIHVQVLWRRVLYLYREGAPPGQRDAVANLLHRTQDLMRRAEPLLLRCGDNDGSCRDSVWKWHEMVMRPLWHPVLGRMGVSDPDRFLLTRRTNMLMDAGTYETHVQSLMESIDAMRQRDRDEGRNEGRNEGWNEGRKALAVEHLVGAVARHGALSDDQLDAYRDRLEDMPGASLPDATQVAEQLVAFPAGARREHAVRTFVDTGRVPALTDVT